MIIAFSVSCFVLLLLYPLAPRLRLLDHPVERRKNHRQPTPTIGGIAIFLAMTAALIVAVPIETTLVFGWAGAALLVAFGTLDDIMGLGPRIRLITQVGAALLLTLGAGVSLTSLGDLFGFGAIDLGLLAIPFSVFAIVGVINAFNMIDGIDGLAGGMTMILFGALLLLAGPGVEQTLILASVAALVPFLISNLSLIGPRLGKVFLGDAGSQLLGYLAAWMLIAATQSPTALEPAVAIWLIAIPLTDTLAV
ncbi:MAG: undecaprenyl/decaprenyl-phosphate alpha-N-acetylglucosaminyl 1-phosphate transferase, partial [Clostridia bacterium]|nr:undecaprenyl/decaprenyl-phosphate alpha-N-acetylglucosaminyl 1-phosphate transferase [Clostridia bacterium]